MHACMYVCMYVCMQPPTAPAKAVVYGDDDDEEADDDAEISFRGQPSLPTPMREAINARRQSYRAAARNMTPAQVGVYVCVYV